MVAAKLALNQLNLRCRRNAFLVHQLCALVDVLRDDVHGDFHHALRADFDAHGTRDASDLLGGGDFLLDEVFGNRARFAGAADHAKKLKRPVNPRFQHERVMLVAARDDQTESRHRRERRGAKLAPVTGAEEDFLREKIMVCQLWSIIKNRDGEIQLQRQRCDGLRDVA